MKAHRENFLIKPLSRRQGLNWRQKNSSLFLLLWCYSQNWAKQVAPTVFCLPSDQDTKFWKRLSSKKIRSMVLKPPFPHWKEKVLVQILDIKRINTNEISSYISSQLMEWKWKTIQILMFLMIMSSNGS
jgi:hypothetical protein